jgi:hypothetical protein
VSGEKKTLIMKEQLQIVQTSISNIFDYSSESLAFYKKHLKIALHLIQNSPVSSNVTLENWKLLAVEELEKELDHIFSEKFNKLNTEEQRSEFKFSKINSSNILMNVLMNL